jgi:hypothetical protein
MGGGTKVMTLGFLGLLIAAAMRGVDWSVSEQAGVASQSFVGW